MKENDEKEEDDDLGSQTQHGQDQYAEDSQSLIDNLE